MSTVPTPETVRNLLRNFQLESSRTGTSEGWFRKSAKHWLITCRSLRQKGSVKTAELGGSADTPFEQAFSNLAHSYLRDKAPKLLEYEVGFQLIEKNQENTKAVGVFGFKVGDQWLYAPVFFLNGDLKGHELLYIKNQDIFVPMKDNWLNYLLGRKPSILGKTVDRNLASIGVQAPNLYQMSRSPYKTAAALPQMAGWFRDFLPELAQLVTTSVSKMNKYASVPTLPEVILELGRPAAAWLDGLSQSYPTLYRAFEEAHPGVTRQLAEKVAREERLDKSGSIMKLAHRWSFGEEPPHKFKAPSVNNGGVASFGTDAWDSLKPYTHKTQREAPFERYVEGKGTHLAYKQGGSILQRLTKQAKKTKVTGNEGRVEVILREDYWNGNFRDYDLSEDEKRKVLEEGRLVIDKREPSAVSKAYLSTTSLQLQNPDETNVYEVLIRPARFEKCLVIMAPYGKSGRESYCTVISLEDDDRWLNIHPSRVWTRTRFSREAWNEWYDKLPEADSLPLAADPWSNGDRVVLLNKAGAGTVPLKAYEEYTGGADHGSVFRVRWDDYCDYENRKPYHQIQGRDYAEHEDTERACMKSVRFTGRAAPKFRVTPDELYVPVGCKKLAVAKPSDRHNFCDTASRSAKPPMQPGSQADITLLLQGNLTPLKLMTDNDGSYSVNELRMHSKSAAFAHLLLDWGFNEETSDSLLKLAELNPRQWYNALVKVADPYLTSSAPSAPGFPAERGQSSELLMSSRVPSKGPDEQEVAVQDMKPNGSNRDLYKPTGPDSQILQVAQQASQTGQKEVFDTAMLGSLLKAVRQDSMVDRYLGDLMKGMDRLGRVYFQFLWHGEEFEDRYGKQDLPELEDGIRNAFESLGDIILVLKRKTVEPFAEQGTDVDLGAVAN